MRPLRSLAPLLLFTIAAIGCAGFVKRSPEQAALESLRAANSVYHDTLISAGRAHHQKLITDAQLAKVETAGTKVEAALLSAQAALGGYLVVKSAQGANDLSASVAAVSAALLQLTNAWSTANGTTATGNQ